MSEHEKNWITKHGAAAFVANLSLVVVALISLAMVAVGLDGGDFSRALVGVVLFMVNVWAVVTIWRAS